jgi:type IV pilus assembly protein PilY1
MYSIIFTLIALLGQAVFPVRAQPIHLSSQPIFSEVPSAIKVRPNIMMVLDDSGSMSWTEMPDTAWDFYFAYGYTSNHCNGVYYNPKVTYTPPLRHNGTSYPNQSFTRAQYDGYNSFDGAFTTTRGTGYLDLSKEFRFNFFTPFSANAEYGVTPHNPVVAFYHIYDGNIKSEGQKTYHDPNSTFYKECRMNTNYPNGATGVPFKLKIVSSTSGPGNTDERTNFANWFSYYRTRMLLMKTATGRAFASINDDFRVGYMSINNATGTDFLNITDFTNTQKQLWYSKLYASLPRGATPLREALADAGKVYAGKKSKHNTVNVIDPVQYACQRNYTILSTDGYWNGVDNNVTKLDGSVMDNQDQILPRPYKDDSVTVYRKTTSQLTQSKSFLTTAITKQMQMRKVQYWYWFFGWQKSTTNCFGCSEEIEVDWTNVNTCTPSNGNPSTLCRAINQSPTPTRVASCGCTPGTGSCQYSILGGAVKTSDSTVTCTFNSADSTKAVASCTPQEPTSSNSFVRTSCNTNVTGPTEVGSCTTEAPRLSNSYTETTCSAPFSTGGTPNTLADTAAYYYNTNLRTSALGNCTGKAPDGSTTNLCQSNKVPPTDQDPATWQHMTTFTLGLGTRGRMVYSPTYLTDTSGDYFDILKGNLAGTNNCLWQGANGQPCNWPKPGMDKIENIDDLWHAAVNGHGNYFSATDPESLSVALSSTLSAIINTPQAGTAASSATSNPKITSSNNFQFSSYFKSLEWSGELIRQPFDLRNGSVPLYNHMNPDTAAYDWSAQAKLDAMNYTERNIYFAGENGLLAFQWSNLNSNQRAHFLYNAIKDNAGKGLSQFCSTGAGCLDSAVQQASTVATNGAAGEALVNFLRGERSNEEDTTPNRSKFYRHRTHVLGDIVSAQPLYVGPPNKTFSDPGYAAFKAAQAKRTALVFAAANDGMLHAFDVETGVERWAFIPTLMLPKLHVLADKNYAKKHQYFVEGTPRSGDVYIGGKWKTILVGGFNAGGNGYYALDITDPLSPKYLWEFTDTHMGYSFGNPEITKLDNGKWVVLVSSGYNNCAQSSNALCATANGDGNGYLYVLDAANGRQFNNSPISTNVGNASGLARIIAQAGPDNVTRRVYGGDLLGNLWRFELETSGNKTFKVQRIAVLKDADGNTQPITSRPQVTTLKGERIVMVGTGRYLASNDVNTTQRQAFYAIKDNVSTSAYDNIRSNANFIKKTAVSGICPPNTDRDICEPGTAIRTVSINTGSQANDSLENKNGWFLDFPAGAGELSITDPKLVRGSVTFTTSVPVPSTASACGDANAKDPVSYSYTLNYLDGGPVNSEVAASTLGVGISPSPQIIQLPDGTILVVTRTQSGSSKSSSLRFQAGSQAGGEGYAKRSSWRELTPR